MNRLHQLHQAGTAIWLDFLRRGLISGGELARMIDERDLSGVTSNPSIFKKAIGGSTDYDEAIAEISLEERDAVDVFYELAQKDIQDAATVFAPVTRRLGARMASSRSSLSPRWLATPREASPKPRSCGRSSTGRT